MTNWGACRCTMSFPASPTRPAGCAARRRHWANTPPRSWVCSASPVRKSIRRSRRFGFIGASVIHPSQVPILNEEFRASAEEVDHARRVVAAYDKALAEGVGAVTVDGKMIDVPVVERAKMLLEREAAIAAREEKTRALGG